MAIAELLRAELRQVIEQMLVLQADARAKIRKLHSLELVS